MLRPRVIPCLLVRDGGLVKTVRFGEGKYVGDPLNAVRIFNEKECDELIVLDIDATAQGREPNYRMIEKLAVECRMPLNYGGGVSTVAQAERIIGLGVEKVSFGAAAVETPEVLRDTAARLGAQSVVGVIDVRRNGLRRRHEVVVRNAGKRTGLDPADFARTLGGLGVGEILLNNVDLDGEMKGYDLDLAARVAGATSLPMTVVGGAGSLDDIAALTLRLPVVGAGAGSLFVFKGRYRAVLINYPDRAAKTALFEKAAQS